MFEAVIFIFVAVGCLSALCLALGFVLIAVEGRSPKPCKHEPRKDVRHVVPIFDREVELRVCEHCGCVFTATDGFTWTPTKQ